MFIWMRNGMKKRTFSEKEMKKMREQVSSLVMFPAKNERSVPRGGQRRQRWIRFLYAGSVGGILVGLSGLLMSGLAWFGVFERTPVFKLIGTWLIIVAFPLVIFGAHAMDKITEIDRNEKRRIFEEKQKQGLYSPEQWKG